MNRRRWIGRICWIAAWGVWVWLGVGLHRELPRSPGAVVSRLENFGKASVLGFVGDTDLIACQKPIERFPHLTTIEVFDANTGKRLHSVRGPAVNDGDSRDNQVQSLRQGLLLATELFGPDGRGETVKLHALDLASGQWRLLADEFNENVSMHPSKPWVAYTNRIFGFDHSVSVVDATNGKKLTTYRVPRRSKLCAPAFFYRDDCLVIVGTQTPAEDQTWWEVLRIGEPAERVAKFDGPKITKHATTSINGRIAFMGRQSSNAIDVFDLDRKEVVFSHPPRGQRGPLTKGQRLEFPVISPNGRTVLGGDDNSLWEIDSRKLIWRPSPWERASASAQANDFFVGENWSGLWSGVLPRIQFRTVARRDFETGKMLWRNVPGSIAVPQYCNAKRSLVVMNDGTVRRLPLEVEYLWLAICQAILALPLLLLWAILRWRRRRRERSAVAT